MIRRYFAAALIGIFFSYAAYLIITNGGKANTIITFNEISTNFHHKLNILFGKKEIKTKADKTQNEQTTEADDSTATDTNKNEPADPNNV